MKVIQVAETITAQLVCETHSVNKSYNFTVKEYAEYILAEGNGYDETTKDLVNAMLSYGKYAKAYFSEEILDATEAMKDIDASDLENHRPEIEGQIPDYYYGSSLLLESKVVIRHYFKQAVEGATKIGEYWCIDITDIPAHELDKKQNTDVGGVVIKYSPLSYAYSVLKSDTADVKLQKLQNLVKAMYLYNQAADAYHQPDDAGL